MGGDSPVFIRVISAIRGVKIVADVLDMDRYQLYSPRSSLVVPASAGLGVLSRRLAANRRTHLSEK